MWLFIKKKRISKSPNFVMHKLQEQKMYEKKNITLTQTTIFQLLKFTLQNQHTIFYLIDKYFGLK